MLSKMIQIDNSIGLHARPAAMLATEAVKYQSETFIRLGTYFADLKN
jgi:phosphotransferase system HPr (HPr) family protein